MTERPVMVITGTRLGIGRGLAEHFAGTYVVAGCSRGEASLVCEGYEHTRVDVSDEEGVRSWVRAIKSRHGRIDVLVCNAGLAPAALLATMTSGDLLASVLKTNVAGTFLVCREVAKVMMQRRSGRIVTLSSMAVGLHAAGTAAYSASKGAVAEMTRVLANELAPAGITCNVLAPSMIVTDAVTALGSAVAEKALSQLTVKRPVTIREIANVIEFFAAEESACITGQTIFMGLVA